MPYASGLNSSQFSAIEPDERHVFLYSAALRMNSVPEDTVVKLSVKSTDSVGDFVKQALSPDLQSIDRQIGQELFVNTREARHIRSGRRGNMLCYKTPGGRYSPLYYDMAQQPHLLISGMTESGKSVVIHGILHALLTMHSPTTARLVLVDPHIVELAQYQGLPHALAYTNNPMEFASVLRRVLDILIERYHTMSARSSRQYDGAHMYVVIDELGDMEAAQRKEVQPILQQILRNGRAARIHVIAATKYRLSDVMPAIAKINFVARVGLHTKSVLDSIAMIDTGGCETLPVGEGIYVRPEGRDRCTLPMIPESEIGRLISYWTSPQCMS